MHAVFLGASRGIGLFALLTLLQSSDQGQWTATLLLRKPEAITSDPRFKEYLEKGRVEIVKGDATNEEDVKKLFPVGKKVDLIVSSVGATPSFTWTGLHIDQPKLCMDSTLALLHVLAKLETPLPRVVAVSSMGIGDNHKVMPYVMQAAYSALLARPHRDKEALEYLLQKASIKLPLPSHAPDNTFLPESAIASVRDNFLPELIIVRPAALVGDDAPPKEKEKIKVGEDLSTYTVRRSEVGRFIAEDCVPGKDEWVNKFPVVGY
ncbi:hypothetical protein CI109_102963 [Kwoniella shandongensis]|uniref:NAD(P)-binding domain-containing protein n=1 Tax=Kwoniella shandongensis TaxID=1734106 RepID=A0A5M6C8S8_9TREE|nr:uncharacterized protein CI109_000151 [Kwoniella shandongensis]KAA5531311.1 hypothetical protein CI109_000151 [Kwoniella shandongensis]